MTHWGGGERDYDPHVEPEYYTAEDGEIVLEHEGELDEKNPDEYLSDIDLGGGIILRINPEYFKMIMHTPEITAMVDLRCEELATEANSLATIEGAEYGYVVSNNTENIRARGRVKPLNEKAHVDDAENSTLLKALATVGSDPLPPQYFSGAQQYSDYLADHASMYPGEADAGSEEPEAGAAGIAEAVEE